MTDDRDLRDGWLATDPLPDEPVAIVQRWLNEAFADAALENPHAVALATIDPDGAPSVRMVLCNAIDVRAGTFTMYTNQESRKGRALANEREDTPQAGTHDDGGIRRSGGRGPNATDRVDDPRAPAAGPGALPGRLRWRFDAGECARSRCENRAHALISSPDRARRVDSGPLRSR